MWVWCNITLFTFGFGVLGMPWFGCILRVFYGFELVLWMYFGGFEG